MTYICGLTSRQDQDPGLPQRAPLFTAKDVTIATTLPFPENFSLTVHFPSYVFAERKTEDRAHGPGQVQHRAGPVDAAPTRGAGSPDAWTYEYTRVSHSSFHREEDPSAASAFSDPQKR